MDIDYYELSNNLNIYDDLETKYDSKYNINKYNNNYEYRINLLNILKLEYDEEIIKKIIDQEYYENIDDDIENDDNEIYLKKITEKIKYIYSITYKQPFFIKIYKIASSKIFSEDAELGLYILFSYDILKSFHNFFCEWLLFVKKYRDYFNLFEYNNNDIDKIKIQILENENIIKIKKIMENSYENLINSIK